MNTLLPVRASVQRFGGSHAQRDVVQLTVLEAALRGGRHRRRVRSRPSART